MDDRKAPIGLRLPQMEETKAPIGLLLPDIATTGGNLYIENEGQTVRTRSNEYESCDVVYSSQPLQTGETFTMRVDDVTEVSE